MTRASVETSRVWRALRPDARLRSQGSRRSLYFEIVEADVIAAGTEKSVALRKIFNGQLNQTIPDGLKIIRFVKGDRH